MTEASAPENSIFDVWAGRIKIILEIIAIPIAAYWAFTRFAEGEAPSLEQRHSTETYLNWFASEKKSQCLGQFGVTFKNIGKTSFEIEKIRLRAWIVRPQTGRDALGYLSPMAFQNEPPEFDTEINNQLVGKVSPDMSVQDDLVFQLRSAPGKFALFRVDATVKPNTSEPKGSQLSAFQWDYICGQTKRGQRMGP